MGRILKLIAEFYTRNTEKLASISKVAGKRLASPDDVANWAKSNKANIALTAVNMGSAGYAVADFLQNDENIGTDVINILSKINYQPDTLAPNAEISIADLPKYKDELDLISRVASRAGGMQRLLEMRAVMKLDDQYFELHEAVRNLRN
jgi:hypothetical protein